LPRVYTPKLELICRQCNNIFWRAPSLAAQGGKFCGHACYSAAKSNGRAVACVGCGITVSVSPSQSKIRKYCTAACRRANLKAKIICIVCGVKRAVTPTNIKEGARFCSWVCARKVLNKPRPTVICKECGKVCSVPPSRIKQGMKFCSQSCRSIYTIAHGQGKRTSIELILYAELDHFGIKYLPQHSIREAHTVPDAYIPTTRTVLYADGDYWHRLPKTAERDTRQNLKLAELGYTVHRFWEKDLRTKAREIITAVVG